MQHAHLPDPASEIRDQHRFDQEVNSTGKLVLQVAAGVAIFAALMMSVVALVKSSQHTEAVAGVATPVLKQTPAAAAAAAAQTAAPVTAETKIVPSWKVGPDGKKHDSFAVTNFTVKVGQKLNIVVDNTDEGSHSMTSPVANVNIVVLPGKHTYTVVFTKPGKFEWHCVIPCDDETKGWAMTHPGYMAGYFNVTPA